LRFWDVGIRTGHRPFDDVPEEAVVIVVETLNRHVESE
jgi:hypothetical protein